jgi:iron complex transport system substrate-binding protein
MEYPPHSALRIVSLLPAATEIVARLGLRDHLVGRSHECDEPPEVRTIPALTAQVAPQGLSPSEIDEAVAFARQNLQACAEVAHPTP